MKVVIFGATGMVGQGVLRECLRDDAVERVLCVTRTRLGQSHPKLDELVHADFTSYTAVEKQLSGYDACFFCLGVSSVGMNEADHVTTNENVGRAMIAVAQRGAPAQAIESREIDTLAGE